MAVIALNNVIGGAVGTLYPTDSAPVTGTSEVQTITTGGTITGGTFTLTLGGVTTAPITWSSTNATFVANVDAALEALPSVGASGVVTAVGSMTSGIGTITCTFSGSLLVKRPVGVMTATSSLTGTSPTVAVAVTTPGVRPTFNGASTGAVSVNTTTGALLKNTGTGAAPTWA